MGHYSGDKEKAKQLLAELIVERITAGFDTKYLTKTLVKSIEIKNGDNGSILIEINAPMYDLKEFSKTGNIVTPDKNKSYASNLDLQGSYWKNHKDYIKKAIDEAIPIWLKRVEEQGKVKEWKD